MFTEVDKAIINDGLEKLLISSKVIIRGDEKRKNQIIRAFEIANNAHWGVRRKSGEPYMIHPLAVAQISVEEIGLGVKSVCAALLHDVVEDTDMTVEDLEVIFGSKIASMVDGLTKLQNFDKIAQTSSQQAENFKKMIYTLSDDVRVILIKLADRLHNMRTLDSMLPHKKTKIVGETLYFFAPLAHRLGLSKIKTELENLSFKHSYPKDYYTIEYKLNETSNQRQEYISRFIAPLMPLLEDKGFEFIVEGREKSPYSVWKKMQNKGIPFEEVYDLFAIRIIFKEDNQSAEKEKSWKIYSIITDQYTPKPDRLRDWISIPKDNGYEALHCTFMGPDGAWVEVQIRSERMDDIAEKGFAAHWKYKGVSESETKLDEWIGKVRNALTAPVEDAVQFLDEFKLNLYAAEIVTFTPDGQLFSLPKGATALDFAYEIHTSLGNKMIGAKVNYSLKPLTYKLESGDQVEIITSQKAQPKIEWTDFVVTAKAKHAIKSFLRKDQTNFVVKGMEIFNTELTKYGIKQSNSRIMQKVLPEYKCAMKDEFYSKIGSGVIKLDKLEQVLKSNKIIRRTNFWSLDLDSVNPFKLFSGGNDKSTKDLTSQNFDIAECCHPIPEDEIVAFNDDNEKIIVHKKNCPVAIDLAAKHGDKIVKANWSTKASMSYLCKIKLVGSDRVGILHEVSQIIATQFNVNIRNLLYETHNNIFECNISIYVKDYSALKQLMSLIQKIKGIDKVSRI